MSVRKDDQDKRIARIEGLMEEYRLKHEDLEAYLKASYEQRRLALERAKNHPAVARDKSSGRKR